MADILDDVILGIHIMHTYRFVVHVENNILRIRQALSIYSKCITHITGIVNQIAVMIPLNCEKIIKIGVDIMFGAENIPSWH